MTDDRVRHLEIEIAALRSELAGHIVLCTGRWNVMWKLATAMAGVVALLVSVAVAIATRSP